MRNIFKIFGAAFMTMCSTLFCSCDKHSDNDWNYPFSSSFWFYEESAEEAFKNITKDYVTLDDVRKIERKEGRIKLYK